MSFFAEGNTRALLLKNYGSVYKNALLLAILRLPRMFWRKNRKHTAAFVLFIRFIRRRAMRTCLPDLVCEQLLICNRKQFLKLNQARQKRGNLKLPW